MKRIFILLLFLPCLSFSQIKEVLWDMNALRKSPHMEWLDRKSPVNSLLYTSVDYEGRPTKVFAYYANPALLSRKGPVGKKYPGVVLVHGGGGKAFKEWVEMWAAKGYAAIAIDLSGRDGKGEKLSEAGPEQSDENKFQKITEGDVKNVWSYHAVASVILAHSLLLDFAEVDAHQTGITGISWGGYLTGIAAGLDSRFKVAVPVYGCGYYDESDVFKEMLHRLPVSDQQKWMQYFDPSAYLALARAKFLFINGNKDLHYNVMPYHKTYLQVKKQHRMVYIKPDMGHSHEFGWEPIEIQAFFDQVFKHKQRLIEVKKVKIEPSAIKLFYKYPQALSEAYFYYSNDTTSSNAKRVWNRQKAVINLQNQSVTTPKMESGFKYGFFSLKDDQSISGSSEFIVN